MRAEVAAHVAAEEVEDLLLGAVACGEGLGRDLLLGGGVAEVLHAVISLNYIAGDGSYR